ncbi:MAG: glycosyltransferase [Thermodesulfobacteriota bacterium]
MNVCHVLTYLAKRYGGPPQVAASIGRHLRARGVGVTYYGTATDEEKREFQEQDGSVRLFDRRKPLRWFRSPDLGKALLQESADTDIIHLHEIWSHPIFCASRVARRKGIPYLLTPHGELNPWHMKSKRLKKRIYLELVLRGILGASACVHVFAPSELEGLVQVGYRGPLTVIPNGVSVDDFTTLLDPLAAEQYFSSLDGKRVVFFMSRLSPEKGLDQLIPAWADVTASPTYDDCVLVLAGPDSRGYDNVVRALLAKHQLLEKVLLTGMIWGHKKLALMARADLYVLPSYGEGFSVSLLENLACGNPVLVTPACNFPEIEKVGAGACVPPERSALAHGLRRLLDLSEEERLAMGQQGRKLVFENYTWDVVARKFLTVYNCILAGKEIPLFPEPAPVDVL